MSDRPSWLARLLGAGKEQDPNRAVPVGFATSRAEAELMAGFLRDNGIQAIVFGDDARLSAPDPRPRPSGAPSQGHEAAREDDVGTDPNAPPAT